MASSEMAVAYVHNVAYFQVKQNMWAQYNNERHLSMLFTFDWITQKWVWLWKYITIWTFISCFVRSEERQ